jgi:predicted naringenin-chalcone synthase
MSRVALIGIGTATPAHTLAQADASALALSFSRDPDDAKIIRALYRRAGVQSRGSVIAEDQGRIDTYNPDREVPTTAQRMRLYEQHACNLAFRACEQALQRAQADARTITHLVTVSCTGFSAPGIDLGLIDQLGLDPAIRRTHVGYMGCHGAINALAIARAFAGSDPNARVLICCVELCTLHFDHAPDAQGHVANALFADGAGAAVVTATESAGTRITDTGSIVIPNSGDMMSWNIGDSGFRMHLSPSVPTTLAKHIPPWLDDWLSRTGHTVAAISSWAVHPGGPRVLSSLSDALGLGSAALTVSRKVLAEHGNMSSATLLFILQNLLDDQCPMPLLAAAFGPGLAGEVMLLE